MRILERIARGALPWLTSHQVASLEDLRSPNSGESPHEAGRVDTGDPTGGKVRAPTRVGEPLLPQQRALHQLASQESDGLRGQTPALRLPGQGLRHHVQVAAHDELNQDVRTDERWPQQ